LNNPALKAKLNKCDDEYLALPSYRDILPISSLLAAEHGSQLKTTEL